MKKLSSDLEGQGYEERERQGRREKGERGKERMIEVRSPECSERWHTTTENGNTKFHEINLNWKKVNIKGGNPEFSHSKCLS